MAYAAVASLLQTIDIILDHHQHSISPEFENQIKSIHQHTCSLRSFIEGSSARVNNWEETIREVTVRAEDIIELLLSDSLLESTVGSSKSEFEKGKYEICYGFDELEEVTEEIESIVIKVKSRRRVEPADGSDDEVMEIVSRIREGSPSLERIAICGSGGMGKTTLARNAYNHRLIVEHFDVRAWSVVSTDNVRRQIAVNLLRFMDKSNAYSMLGSENVLIESVRRMLSGRRYLIVLDDVWTLEDLDGLKFMLPDDGNGSRIIFTSRSLEVAKSACHIHEMSLLDEDQAWDMLQKKIFKGDPCPFQLEFVGKTIAKRCRGHLLSIEVVSGILAADETVAAWEDVSENIKIASEDAGEETMQVLSLSYTYLPHHLRPCFLYLGIFPRKTEVRVSNLVKLWVAEGFLNQSAEDTGRECVKDLARRKLVSVYRRKSNGGIKGIVIHDLMRDMCLRQAYIDNFISNPVGRLQWCRRVISSICGNEFLEALNGSTVRTIVLPFDGGREYNIRSLVGNVRLLRILDLSNANNFDLPMEVFELFHLRYLAFRFKFGISGAISKLENLQTLIIIPHEKNRMFTLPGGIWRMPLLRHLFMFPLKLPRLMGLMHLMGPMPALENLQTLSGVVDFVCSMENLNMIQNVKKLFVYFTHDRGAVENYKIHNLIYLQKLEILKIKMDWSFVERRKMSCAFPPTLKKLNLCGLQLPWEDMKIVASLPNLQVLKLRNHACVGQRWETSEGGFSQLRFLLIEKSDLEQWITETSHFPKLKSLVLRECLNLREVQHSVGVISTLKLIEADYSNLSLLVSLKQIQEDRQSLEDNPLKLVLGEGENKHVSEN